MRIYSNPYELMSETARNLYEMGNEVKPRTYQNKVIEGKDDFITKELICEQYCLTHMEDPAPLFVFTKSKDWADAELEERVSGRMENPGKAWELRKDIWEEFLVGVVERPFGIVVLSENSPGFGLIDFRGILEVVGVGKFVGRTCPCRTGHH